MAIQRNIHPPNNGDLKTEVPFLFMKNDILKELALAEKLYDDPIEIVPGLMFNQKRTIEQVEFYTNSAYLNGPKDSQGRDKPFYNIVNANKDVSVVACDIDTKDIQVVADDPANYDRSFLMSKEVAEWMKEADFAQVLNDIGDTRATYGGVIVKKCLYTYEDDTEELKLEVPEWKNLITDQTCIEDGIIIEKHYMTPYDLEEKSDIWDETAIRSVIKQTVGTGKNYKGLSAKICVWEMRGYFPEKMVEGESDKFTYQLHIIAGENPRTVIYQENNTEEIYKYLPWKKKSGRGLGLGVVEEGIPAQIWTNDAILKERDAIELTSKTVLQSASKKLKGRNILTELENGTILEHEDGKPITNVSLLPAGALAQFQNLIDKWKVQYERATSTYDAVRGETPPSGQPFRLQALVLNQSNSSFDYRKEEMGIFLQEIFYDWVFPYLSKRLNKEHILSHDFTPDELKSIDQAYATHRANEAIKKKILSGQLATPEEYDQLLGFYKEQIGKTKGQRFIEIPKDYYKDMDMKLSIDPTGESKNKMATLESLTNIFTLVAQNPNVLQDPVLSQVFSKIIELSGSGISPVAINSAIQEQPTPAMGQMEPSAPQGQPVGNLEANPVPQINA